MNANESMNGKYFKTCSKDITSSEGWLKRMLTLALIEFIPVFGSMTVYGYAYEWAHKAAWGVSSPMPGKIYGRTHSKMVRWGAYAWVIAFVFGFIPALLAGYDSFISLTSANSSVISMHRTSLFPLSSVRIFSFLQIVMWILECVLSVLAWIGSIRMTIYDKLGAGFQLGQIVKMARHDLGGLLRIFGMNLLFSTLFLVVFIVLFFIVTIFAFFAAAVLGYGISDTMSSSGYSGVYANSAWSVIGVLTLLTIVGLPMYLVIIYLLFVTSAWLNILTARAIGYWTRQFDVAHWGRQQDPLPFERAGQKRSADVGAAAQSVAQSAAQSAGAAEGAPAGEEPAPVPETVGVSAPDAGEEPAGEPAVASEPAPAPEPEPEPEPRPAPAPAPEPEPEPEPAPAPEPEPEPAPKPAQTPSAGLGPLRKPPAADAGASGCGNGQA